MTRDFLNPAGLSSPVGYTHIVTATSGKQLFISGQVALDAEGRLVGRGDLSAQTRQVCENLKTALAAAGGSLADIVKITSQPMSSTTSRTTGPSSQRCATSTSRGPTRPRARLSASSPSPARCF